MNLVKRWWARTDALPPVARQLLRILLLAIVAGLPAFIVLRYLGPRVVLSPAVPDVPSMVELEVAGSTDRFASVVRQASTRGADLAGPLRWDYLFLMCYGAGLFLSARRLGPRGYRIARLTSRARTVGTLALVAAGLDAVENTLLLSQLHVRPDALAVGAAAACAWTKFLLLSVVLLYVAGAMAGYVVRPGLMPPADQDDRADSADPGVETGDHDATAMRRGVAISGGGVRSATFALGVLQRLEHADELAWDRLGRITSISGGSYMAGAWTIARMTGTTESPAPWARREPDAPGPEERYLREHLGYLLEPAPERRAREGSRPVRQSPDLGSPAQPVPRNRAGAVGVLLAGLVCNLTVLAALLVLVATPLGWLAGSDLVNPSLRAGRAQDAAWVPSVAAPVVMMAVLTVGVLAVWALSRRTKSARWDRLATVAGWIERRAWPLGTGLLAATATLATLLLGLPWALQHVPAFAGPGATMRWVQALAAAGFLGSVAALAQSVKGLWSNPIRRWIPRLGGVLLAVLAILVGGQVAYQAARSGPPRGDVLLVVAGAAAAGYLLINPEWWAPASFYRARLRSAYALKRTGDGITAYDGRNEPLLAAYAQGTAEPSTGGRGLMVCATANVSSRTEYTVYGIPAWSLTFSPAQVVLHQPVQGGPGERAYRCTPDQLSRVWSRFDNPRLTVTAAVAMSGAAIAPGLGRAGMGTTNALIALANLRLGVWLPNPRYAGRVRSAGPSRGLWPDYPRLRLGYLIKEMLGIFDPADLYLYVTDGGHWDNSGVVEQLRDADVCELLCVDGSGAAAGAMDTLADAMTLARAETGAEIRIDFAPFRLPAGSHHCRRPVTVGTVHYPHGRIGLVWYCRPAITTGIRPVLAAFRERNPSFPADSTIDQFFSDLQFESYRQLGYDTADELLDARRQLVDAMLDAPGLDSLRAAATTTDRWPVREIARHLTDANTTDQQYRELRSTFVSST